MASREIALAATLAAIVAGLCAYTNHMEFLRDGEKVVLDNEALHRDSRYAAEVAMDLQRQCLAKDRSQWCNRDLRFHDHYRGSYRELATKQKYMYALGSSVRQERNQWLLVFGASIAILCYQASGWLRQ